MQGPGIRNPQDPPTLDQTSVYSLADGGTLVTHYSDYGTANQDKPDWGALYPDGTMFVANSKDGFHAYQGDSDLFATADAGSGLPSTAPHHDRAGCLQPDDAADVLAEIDAKDRNIHHPFLLLNRRRPYGAGRRGGPFHKTSRAR